MKTLITGWNHGRRKMPTSQLGKLAAMSPFASAASRPRPGAALLITVVLALAGMGAASHAQPSVSVVQGLNVARAWWPEVCLVSGDGLSLGRSLLVSSGNYTIGTGVAAITPETLAGVDIFVINPLKWWDDGMLTPRELYLLEAWVARGGAVLEFRNWPQTAFGVQCVYWTGTSLGDVANTALPAVAELMGGWLPDGVNLGAHSDLSTTQGIAFLRDRDLAGSPFGYVFPPTSVRLGRAVTIADEEIFYNGNVEGAPCMFNANNQTLWVKIFDYLAKAPGVDANNLMALRVEAGPRFDLNAMGIAAGTKNSLLAKLNAAIESFEIGEWAQARNQLKALINEAEAQRGKKLSEGDADALILAVMAIVNQV